MQNDTTTLRDLSIFNTDSNEGVFALIDHTTTQAGRDMLRRHIQNPPETYEKLREVQDAIKFWTGHLDKWPTTISNGTLVMLEKFFETADNISAPPSGITLLLSAWFQKILNRQEYFLTQFSLSHIADFLKGCATLAAMAQNVQVPSLLQRELQQIADELKHRLTPEVMAITKETKYTELSQLNYRVRREMKGMIYRLMVHYARLDAWQSMAKATLAHKWTFPELLASRTPSFEVQGLSHPLLSNPVSYDVAFDSAHNFLLLTGANMSGKTTFMRALGIGALLAHLGMGVPARSLRISFLQGIITNMQVQDNILKGESYFFAEVQRMKHTAEKLLQPLPHLVLMDELFKGTNVHDAFECTKAVLEGLLHHRNHLMILSTHLYEVAQQFSDSAGIQFSYFVTQMAAAGGYDFTYELKKGISNDRIGYLILQKEGVLNLLERTTASSH